MQTFDVYSWTTRNFAHFALLKSLSDDKFVKINSMQWEYNIYAKETSSGTRCALWFFILIDRFIISAHTRDWHWNQLFYFVCKFIYFNLFYFLSHWKSLWGSFRRHCECLTCSLLLLLLYVRVQNEIVWKLLLLLLEPARRRDKCLHRHLCK